MSAPVKWSGPQREEHLSATGRACSVQQEGRTVPAVETGTEVLHLIPWIFQQSHSFVEVYIHAYEDSAFDMSLIHNLCQLGAT